MMEAQCWERHGKVLPRCRPCLCRLVFGLLFQHMMTDVTDRIDRIVDLTDPLLCDSSFLPWLASWVGFELDQSLPVHQQRELVRRAIRLFRTRGTRLGIEEMVRVLTSAPVRVSERRRPHPVCLGQATLLGGQDVVGSVWVGRGTLCPATNGWAWGEGRGCDEGCEHSMACLGACVQSVGAQA